MVDPLEHSVTELLAPLGFEVVEFRKVGTAEPAAWGATFTDSTAALQGAGSIGFDTYLSGSATNAPQIASFDDLWAGPPQ